MDHPHASNGMHAEHTKGSKSHIRSMGTGPKKLAMHRPRRPNVRQPKVRQPDERPNSHQRGYCGNWKRLRLTHLAREPLCRMCLKANRYTSASEVDHILPLAAGGERFDSNNLQSLCRPCHQEKTREDKKKGHVYKYI